MNAIRPKEERRAVLERAVVSYQSYLRVVASRKIQGREGGIEAASDFVQMTMHGAIQDIRQGKGPEGEDGLKNYLRNRMRNEFKRVFRRKRLEPLPLGEVADGCGTTPSGALRGDLRQKRLAIAIEGLSPDERQLLIWTNDEKLGYAEIARRRGCSPTYARRLCLNLLDKLRDAMKLGSTV